MGAPCQLQRAARGWVQGQGEPRVCRGSPAYPGRSGSDAHERAHALLLSPRVVLGYTRGGHAGRGNPPRGPVRGSEAGEWGGSGDRGEGVRGVRRWPPG